MPQSLARMVALSKAVERVKASSSLWIKTQDPSLSRFAWQAGYGAFSVSASHVAAVRSYIARQHAHHGGVSFEDEFRAMLSEYEIAFDERYVWD